MTNRLQQEIEESKLQSHERKVVITAKQKVLDRQIRTDESLVELNSNIKKLIDIFTVKKDALSK